MKTRVESRLKMERNNFTMSNNKEKHIFKKRNMTGWEKSWKHKCSGNGVIHIENAYRKKLKLTQRRRNALLIRTGKQPESGIWEYKKHLKLEYSQRWERWKWACRLEQERYECSPIEVVERHQYYRTEKVRGIIGIWIWKHSEDGCVRRLTKVAQRWAWAKWQRHKTNHKQDEQ